MLFNHNERDFISFINLTLIGKESIFMQLIFIRVTTHTMTFSKKILLPVAVAALVNACAPYPPIFQKKAPPAPSTQAATKQATITDAEQAAVAKAKAKAAAAAKAAAKSKTSTSSSSSSSSSTSKPKMTTSSTPTSSIIKPVVKPSYPTATAVPGKPGFVFNPYTHNTVNVQGVASGRLVRDPEDADTSHKFRVP